jgi:isopentenyl diphosphate isomerase/L-lactate dehydrogenase-like FMN-dependent dehydrogenase
VGPATEVYVDGGVRDARQALAALALGGRGVFLGRLPLYALAANGDEGVRTMFDELRTELVDALTLAGCASVAAVPGDLLLPCPGPSRC